MSTPKRYSDGVSNIASGKTMSNYPALDPTLTYGYFNDFFTYVSTDWVATATSVGAGTSAAAMSDTTTGGAIVITNAANEDDSYWLQLAHNPGTGTADSETFLFATGKKAWFKCRFQGNDVDQTDYIVGLHITATDPIDTAPTDGVWFQSDDGDANIDFHVVKDSVYTSSSAVASLSDDTWVTVGFYWDGVDTFHIFVNDAEVATCSSGTLPDNEYLAVSFGCQNGEATANTMTIDYIGAWMER